LNGEVRQALDRRLNPLRQLYSMQSSAHLRDDTAEHRYNASIWSRDMCRLPVNRLTRFTSANCAQALQRMRNQRSGINTGWSRGSPTAQCKERTHDRRGGQIKRRSSVT